MNQMKINLPFGALCLGVGFGLGFLCFNSKKIESAGATPVIHKTVGAAGRVVKSTKPWGNVEALKIPLADSQNLFPDREVRMQKAHWFFENYSPAQLSEFLVSCGLTSEEQKELRDNSPVELATNGCLMHPSESLIRQLAGPARGKIYSILGKSAFNYAQQFPFRFESDGFESRFGGSGLSADKLALIRSLTYTNEGDLCLTDLQAFPGLLSPEDSDRAIEALYRFPAYRLRLRLFSDSNIDELVNYWGRGGREQRIRPLISSLTHVPKEDGASINISYLLPAFARLRLYSFPSSWSDKDAARQDCFWSSMNFFNDEPDSSFFKPDHVKEVLQTHYHTVQGEPKFGDLITLIDHKGNGLHMCVYLADDFVFTKNGINILSPWVIMKTSDMLRLFFPSKESHSFVIYRRNDLS